VLRRRGAGARVQGCVLIERHAAQYNK
jgi:hypothetical protein